MKIKSEKDFWSGVLFLVVGIAFAWAAGNYSFGSAARPGPAYFPFGLGVLLALLGAGVIAKSVLAGGPLVGRIGGWPLKPVVTIVLAVVAFGWLLPRVGLVVALPLLVAGAAAAGPQFRWREVLVIAVVLTGASSLIFVQGLGLTIPLWPALHVG